MGARPKRSRHGNKVKASVSLDPDLYEWAMGHMGSGRRFASLSHALDSGLAALRDADARKRS